MAPNIPSKARAVVIEEKNGPWAIKEVPVEQPKQGEILVKVKACGVCHSGTTFLWELLLLFLLTRFE